MGKKKATKKKVGATPADIERARRDGTTVPGSWGGSRWDGRKKFRSRKKGEVYVNHQGRVTITAMVFGLIRAGKSEDEILLVISKMYPQSRYLDEPDRNYSTYKYLERKDRAERQVK